MSETITIVGTGGIIEGNLGTSNVNVNLDKSLMFDGTNDFVQCGTDTDWDFTDHFTLACWAKNDNASTTGGDREHLIAKYAGSSGQRIFRLYLHGSTLRFGVGYNSGDSSVEINHSMTGLAEHWNHYAATFDGGVMKLYVNGVLVTNTDNSGTLTSIHSNNAVEVNLGAYQDGSHTWTGQMADARIYNAVLTDANIQLLASKINTNKSLGAGTTNLKGYWKLNTETASGGGTGTGFVPDDSGTTNEGDLENFTGTYWDYDAYSVDVQDNSTTTDGTFTVTQGKVEGLALSSVEFNGSDDFININNPLESWTESAQKTMTAWVYNDGNSNVARVFNTGFEESGNKTAFGLGISLSGHANKPFAFLRDTSGGAIQQAFGEVHTNNTWMHYAIVQDGANDKAYLYQNGVLQATVSSVGEINATATTSAKIGKHWSGGETSYFDGKIKDVRLYDYNFSDEQVSSLYSGDYNVIPLHWWKLDEGYTSGTTANTAGAFEDSGTGTDYDAQGSGLVNASCVNGTLDLDGTLTIAANGTLSAPRGNLDIEATDFDTTGTFTHNNGKVRFVGSGNHITIKPNGRAFYNVDVDKDSGHDVKLREDMIIENVLDLTGASDYFIIDANGAGGDVTLTMGTSSASGTIESSDVRRFRLNTHSVGKCIIQGASSLFPCNVTGQDWKWDYGSGAAGTELANMNFQVDVDTHSDGSNAAKITLTGDCEFDAVTVNSGDTLDLNGQRAKLSGTLTGAGTLACGTNALIETAGIINFDNSGTWSGNCSIISTASANHYFKPASFAAHNVSNLFLKDGANPQRWGNNFVQNIIVGGGTQSFGDPPPTTDPIENITIATGATVNGADRTLTFDGDFTTSGGLIGLSGLDFDGSTATSSPFTFLDVPYDLSNLQNSDATIEMWIFPESKSGDAKPAGIINGYVGGQTNRWQFDHLTNDTFNFNSHENNQAINFTPNIGKMNHIALVFDDSENLLQIYHDGKLVGQNTLGTGIDLGTVGADPDLGISWQTTAKDTIRSGYMGFKGQFYMYRIFNTARTPAQLRADMFNTHGNMANTTGLQVMYQFDEGTGGAGDTVDNKEGTASRDGVLSNSGAAPNWVGAGTFDKGTSTIDMTGDGTINLAGGVSSFHSLKVAASGKTTTLSILAGSSDIRFHGTLTHGGGTANSSGNPSWTMKGSSTVSVGSDWDNWYLCYWESSAPVPAATWRYWLALTDSTLAGDMTCNGYIRPHQSVVNSGDYTITAYNYISSNGGGLNMGAGSLILTHAQGVSSTTSSSVFTAGPGATITGVGAKSTFMCQNNFQIVGDITNLNVTNEELTVVGTVTNCTGDIIQFTPGHDITLSLETDTAEDRDIRLGGPSLDNANHLIP